MLVRERMSTPVISVNPDMPIMEAFQLMQTHRIRRTPVINKGKLVGIVSDKDLMQASPSDATTLSVWELNYLLSKVQIKEVMTRKVLTVHEQTSIEEAAFILADNKIGGLPVMRGEEVVGLITETDLFKILLELMGAQKPGVRVTALVPDELGELDRLTHAIAEAEGSFVSFGQFSGENESNRIVTFKVVGVEEETIKKQIKPFIERLIDIRTVNE